ncbi:MAG: DUF4416 family protein [Candidatus Aminicenantes bacterium]|nr:DUF4416 family protein [Candidatus Aminicenantes bacterium]MCK5004847.1 DUF4416 family protein [Candidatus Aminicenantes bacterium]
MGQKSTFKKVNLFTGLIFNNTIDIEPVISLLKKEFSETDMISDQFEFDFTDYYFMEMGKPLSRKFFSFSRLISPEELPEIKLRTNEIEKEFSISGSRKINLDPGYLSDANVIIATTKNYYQRIPLNSGIYAHMEYVIKGKNLNILEWTYPDFRSEKYIDFFQEMLFSYKKKISLERG